MYCIWIRIVLHRGAYSNRHQPVANRQSSSTGKKKINDSDLRSPRAFFFFLFRAIFFFRLFTCYYIRHGWYDTIGCLGKTMGISATCGALLQPTSNALLFLNEKVNPLYRSDVEFTRYDSTNQVQFIYRRHWQSRCKKINNESYCAVAVRWADTRNAFRSCCVMRCDCFKFEKAGVVTSHITGGASQMACRSSSLNNTIFSRRAFFNDGPLISQDWSRSLAFILFCGK